MSESSKKSVSILNNLQKFTEIMSNLKEILPKIYHFGKNKLDYTFVFFGVLTALIILGCVQFEDEFELHFYQSNQSISENLK